MKIRKFNESKDPNYLLFYSFDWDDNILFMPTEIMLWDDKDEWVGIETGDWAKFRSIVGKESFTYKGHNVVGWPKKEDGSPDFGSAFVNFRDSDPNKNIYLEDTKKAVQSRSFGPAWDDFIECLTHGSLFSIITARAHEPQTIREAVQFILDNVLTEEQKHEMYNHLLRYVYLFKIDNKYPKLYQGEFTSNLLIKDYLDNCDFVGVSSPSNGGTPDNPEKAKVEALLKFKKKVNNFAGSVGMKAKIGFSDDDLKNVKHIEDLFDTIDNEEFIHIEQWVVKNTNNPENVSKKRINRFKDFEYENYEKNK